MTQQYPQQPVQPQQPPAPKTGRASKIGWGVLIALVAFAAGAVAGNASGTSGSAAAGRPAPATTVTVTEAPPAPAVEETTEPPAPTYGTPTKADFTLTAKVLSKQCFGSAGCNLTYRILISYTGPDLDPTMTYEVLYEVRGGEDGPVTNTLTVSGGTSSVDEEESVGTKSSKTKLTAVVTDVLSGS